MNKLDYIDMQLEGNGTLKKYLSAWGLMSSKLNWKMLKQ